MELKILINHVGYLTHGPKFFVVEHPRTDTFTLLDRNTLRPIYEGRLRRVSGDLGDAFVGDFSDFTQSGAYLIECPGFMFEYPVRSQVVVISDVLYHMPIRTISRYFTLQRCGNTYENWCGPCHGEDAFCEHLGQDRDLTGGWHQSCDLRKWVQSSSWAFYALEDLYHYAPLAPVFGEKPLEEMKWGNRYFQNLIQEDGRLLDSVIYPNHFGKRKVFADHPPFFGVFNVINAQCICARAFRQCDPAYAARCEELACRVYAYYTSADAPTAYNPKVVPPFHDFLPKLFVQNYKGSALYTGGLLYCALELYKTTGSKGYLAHAEQYANELCKLQDRTGGETNGAFYRDGNKDSYISTTDDGALGPMALVALSQVEVANKAEYLKTACLYAEHLLHMASKNPWGMIACYLYKNQVDGSRPMGGAYYRYFADDYEFGCNKELLGRALFLLALYQATSDKRLHNAAARIADFILGVNMMNISTVEGVGRNQPQRLINTTEFDPKVPQIPGAVFTGFSGYPLTDEPYADTSLANEYDMPATAFMLMLLIRLQQAEEAAAEA